MGHNRSQENWRIMRIFELPDVKLLRRMYNTANRTATEASTNNFYTKTLRKTINPALTTPRLTYRPAAKWVLVSKRSVVIQNLQSLATTVLVPAVAVAHDYPVVEVLKIIPRSPEIPFWKSSLHPRLLRARRPKPWPSVTGISPELVRNVRHHLYPEVLSRKTQWSWAN